MKITFSCSAVLLVIMGAANSPAQITRDQIITTAETYIDVQWYCSSENINHSEYMDYGGIPCDFSIGWHTGEAYSYGGNDKVSTYLTRIAAGDGAGSHLAHYEAAGGTPWWATGIDCSAFVSWCWEIPRQSTRTLPNYSTEIPRDALLAGDILNVPASHVRLFDKRAADGRPIVYEASGSATKCVHRTVDWGSYTPLRFNELMIAIPEMIVKNVGNYSIEVSWSAVADASSYQLYFSTDGITYSDMGATTELARTFTNLLDGRQYYFRLSARNAQGETSGDSEVLGTLVASAPSQILIVNGFDRMSTGDNSRNYIVQHGKALASLNQSFDSCCNEAVIRNQVNLNDYPVVMWMLGEESVSNSTFNAQEQARVQTYLQNGGNLFVSGAEIGWDLEDNGNGVSFYHNYLKASYVADDANVYQVSGVAGSIFEGLASIHFDDGSHGTYDVDWPECMAPYSGASVCLNYDGTAYHAAIQYEGTFGASQQTGRLVHFGFPFETVFPDSNRNRLMERILDYFDIQSSAVHTNGSAIQTGQRYALLQNYPNPFNATTIIRFEIPQGVQAQLVTLVVYNILGERVKQLVAENRSAGYYQVAWDGTDDFSRKVSAGVYLYKLSAGHYTETKRMLLLE
ncbi:MAG: FlgD immunoglobulin-like domain containing protein [Candidatus Zhuqueibacterota bacterium]